MLALTLALRELRGGWRDLRIFIGCLVIGVSVIAAVGTLSERIEQGIREQAKTLLGGDVEITLTNMAANAQQLAMFRAYGHFSLSVSLSAMALYQDNTVLVEIEGVDGAYPLLGKVELSSGRPLQEAISGNRVVAGKGLFERLGASPGKHVTLGITPFILSDAIRKEPGRIPGAFSLGPRVIASLDGLRANAFLLPGSLIRYHYHILLADPARLNAFVQALKEQFPHAPWIVKTYHDSNQTVTSLVDRLELFMTLAGLSSLLIGGVGILNAARSYAGKKYVTIATLKALGGSGTLIFAVYMIVLFIVSGMGAAASAVLGELLSFAAVPYLAKFFPITSHAGMEVKPLLLAMLFGMLTVFTFSVAAVGRAVEVKPTLLFRGLEIHPPRLSPGRLAANVILGLALVATLVLSASDKAIAVGFIGSALLTFGLFYGLAAGIRRAALKTRFSHPALRLAVANLHRPGSNVFSIMLSIGIGLSVLVALLETEGNIRREIGETIPANAPSLFLIDIQPGQKEPLLALLRGTPPVSDIACQPMVRGRISRLNHVPVESAPVSQDAKWAIESDRGISFTAAMPSGTHLVKGQWWPQNYSGPPLLSLDRSLARGMRLGIGDALSVNILGQDIEARIANLRDVNYANFHINFAMILSPGAIKRFPATYIATLRVANEEDENRLARTLAKQFPNISTIRIRDSLAELEDIVGDIAAAIRVTAVAALLCGFLVLASALAATLDARVYDTVVMKVVGARKRDILAIFCIEWALLGVVTAIFASIIGSAGAWLILQRFEWVRFHLMPVPLLATMLLALASMLVLGLWIQTRIFSRPSATLLRNE